MKARIILNRSGSVLILIDEGTPEQASEAVQALMNKLSANGLKFAEVGEPEQHRHDEEELAIGNQLIV